MNFIKPVFLILIPFSFSSANLLFSDHFDSEMGSISKWFLSAEQGGKLTFESGKAVIDNQSCRYSAIAVHEFDSPPSQFTYSAEISSENPGAGLYFCIQDTNGVFAGYAVIVEDDGLALYKFLPDNGYPLLLYRKKSAFLEKQKNTISVSKNGNRYLTACNGYYQFSVADTSYGSGSIALLVPPGSSAAFDNVAVFDTVQDSLSFPAFVDYLTDEKSGWENTGTGRFQFMPSGLLVSTIAGQFYFREIKIPLFSFHIKAICSYSGGNLKKPYGVFFKDEKADTEGRIWEFGVDGSRDVGLYDSLSGSNPHFNQIVHGASNENSGIIRDTLELIKPEDEKKLSFVVNSVTIGTFESNENFGSFGIFVSDSLDIQFEYFSIEPFKRSYTKVIKPKPRIIRKSSGTLSFDLLGRRVFDANNISGMILYRYGADNINKEIFLKNSKLRKDAKF